MLRVLLDTTYFLPVFGVAVKGLDPKDLDRLRQYALQGKVEIYYTDLMWLELIPKLYREAEKKGIDLEPILRRGVHAITSADYLRKAEVTWRAIVTAFLLRRQGHRDMIDNFIYGIAEAEGLTLITMDKTLRDLARDRGAIKATSLHELLEELR